MGVVAVDNGTNALDVLDASFHAVVLDEMMPGMRGMEVLQEIRKRSELEGICVIMLTAIRDPQLIVHTFQYTPQKYLFKPTAPEDLYRALAAGIAKTSSQLRPIRVFLCHSNADKPPVRDLYDRLKRDVVEPWLDEQNLLVGSYKDQ